MSPIPLWLRLVVALYYLWFATELAAYLWNLCCGRILNLSLVWR